MRAGHVTVTGERGRNAMSDITTLTVADAATTDVIVLRAAAQVREAAERLHTAHVSGAPVVDDSDRLVAVVTMRDLLRYARAETLEMHAPFEYFDRSLTWLPGLVVEAGTTDPVTARMDWPLERAATTMRANGSAASRSWMPIAGWSVSSASRSSTASSATWPAEGAAVNMQRGDQHRAPGQAQHLVGNAADEQCRGRSGPASP
jgi:CBS domain-containing protein